MKPITINQQKKKVIHSQISKQFQSQWITL